MSAIEDFESDGFRFVIAGHSARYNLTNLQRLFGEGFCKSLEAAWRRAASHKPGSTAYNYFKLLRRLLVGVGAEGASGKDAIVRRVYVALRDGVMPIPKDWQHVINEFLRLLGDLDGQALMKSDKRTTHDKYVEAARGALNWLSDVNFLPRVLMRQRLATKFDIKAATDSIASLLYKAAKLNLSGMSELDACNEYIATNAKALTELRQCLVAELLEEYGKFEQGRLILESRLAITLQEFEQRIINIQVAKIEGINFSNNIGLSDSELFAMMVVYYREVFHNRRRILFGRKKFQRLVAKMGGPERLQSFIEATTKALNATYHIILIDTGLNAQPAKDLGEDPYISEAKRGRRVIATISEKKNRAGAKQVKGRLVTDEVAELSVKIKGGISGVRALEMFREMAAC